MPITDWSTDEVQAEITDCHETLKFLELLKEEQHIELNQQLARSESVYGLNEWQWPASTVHAIEKRRQDLAETNARISGATAYLAELVCVA